MNSITLRTVRTSTFQPARSSALFLLLRPQSSQPSLLTQARHASNSSTPTTTSSSSPTYSAPRSPVNGPISTLPPPLTVPERKPDERFFPAYAFRLGKSYITFYKAGAKAIYTNFKSARPLQVELDNKYKGSLEAAIDDKFLNRNQFQLLTRSWFDVKRVPLFALVFAICGEFTPLVVIAVTSIVPYVCRIPKQIIGDRKTLESRRGISFRNLTADLPKNGDGVKDLNRMQALHICWSLGLSSSVWDYLGGQLPGLPTMILRSKVDRRVKYLEMDDLLIKRDGGVKEMSQLETEIACVERGIDVVGRDEKQIKTSLKAWLNSREKASIERLLLTR